VTGIATAFRSESPVLHIGGQGALTQHKMGSLQDLPHVDLMSPITKVRRHGTEHRARRGHDLDGRARGIQRRPGTGVPGNSARCPRSRGRGIQGHRPEARPLPRLDPLARDPRDIEKLADLLVNSEASGDPVRTAGVGGARP